LACRCRRCGAAPARAIAELTSARAEHTRVTGSMKRPDKICVSLPSFLCHFRRRLISTRSSMQRRPRTYWNWQLLLELQDFKNSHRIKCSFSLEFQKYIHSIYNINKDNKFQPNQNLPCFLNFSLFANSFIFNM